jgi:uncharacterized SAM-binding protein YcdF (DUF218 family)
MNRDMNREASRAVADAIVVLGARIGADGTASPALARRIELGIALFQAGLAKRLVLSGGGRGRTRATMREADIMQAIAIAAGVPKHALLIERDSRNTVENAIETARLLAAVDGRSVVLVTDRHHARRARLLFRAAGLMVVALHAPPRPLGETLPQAGAELVRLPVSLLRLLLQRR